MVFLDMPMLPSFLQGLLGVSPEPDAGGALDSLPETVGPDR
jgi:hypothetical protein